MRPTKTESKKMLFIEGGNDTLLTQEIDIQALRDFQYKSSPDQGDVFKHLPPGFENEKVRKC